MGKTIKKNQTRAQVRGVRGARYIVRGKTFGIEDATSAGIAADMLSNGYRSGAEVKWNGGAYRLTVDYFGTGSLERLDIAGYGL